MKIFYAVQATGNGHISRAMQLLPHLKEYGKVDVLLSGSNSSLKCNTEAFRSRGLSFHYTANGRINYLKSLCEIQPARIYREAMNLPLEKYDIIINDFESVAALGCRLRKIPFLHVGHQASFTSAKSPRPFVKNPTGEFILKNYCKSPHYLGFHFLPYDDAIHPPVIKSEIKNAKLSDKGHICIYLPQYTDEIILKTFLEFDKYQFHVFSKTTCLETKNKNIKFFPVDHDLFNASFISCHGIITGAGFETPAEALYLKKRLMCIPVEGQYEQLCNAAALQHFYVSVQKTLIATAFKEAFIEWLKKDEQKSILQIANTTDIAKAIIEEALQLQKIPLLCF